MAGMRSGCHSSSFVCVRLLCVRPLFGVGVDWRSNSVFETTIGFGEEEEREKVAQTRERASAREEKRATRREDSREQREARRGSASEPSAGTPGQRWSTPPPHLLSGRQPGQWSQCRPLWPRAASRTPTAARRANARTHAPPSDIERRRTPDERQSKDEGRGLRRGPPWVVSCSWRWLSLTPLHPLLSSSF
jgi:hypothetical protein